MFGAAVAFIAYLRQSSDNASDLEAAKAAVKEARERLLAEQIADEMARKERLERIYEAADKVRNDPTAAARLLRSITAARRTTSKTN